MARNEVDEMLADIDGAMDRVAEDPEDKEGTDDGIGGSDNAPGADDEGEPGADLDPVLLALLDVPPAEEHLESITELFPEIDTNGDGMIQLEEITNSMAGPESERQGDDTAWTDLIALIYSVVNKNDFSGGMHLEKAAKFMEMFNHAVFKSGMVGQGVFDENVQFPESDGEPEHDAEPYDGESEGNMIGESVPNTATHVKIIGGGSKNTATHDEL